MLRPPSHCGIWQQTGPAAYKALYQKKNTQLQIEMEIELQIRVQIQIHTQIQINHNLGYK